MGALQQCFQSIEFRIGQARKVVLIVAVGKLIRCLVSGRRAATRLGLRGGRQMRRILPANCSSSSRSSSVRREKSGGDSFLGGGVGLMTKPLSDIPKYHLLKKINRLAFPWCANCLACRRSWIIPGTRRCWTTVQGSRW